LSKRSPPRSPAPVALAIALAVAATAATSAAEAGAKEEAQKHFKTGTELMKIEDFKGAVAEFAESVKLFPTKNGLFNYGNCLRALHRYGEALDAFDRLEQEFGDEIDKEMRKALDRQREEIRAVVAELVLRVNQTGASVTVDGREIGHSPLTEPLVLGPGPHTVKIAAGGYAGVEINVTLVSGEKKVHSIELEPVSAELMVSANVAGAQIFVDGDNVGETPLADPLTVSSGEHFVRISRDGYQEIDRKINLETGDNLTLDFTLMPAPDDEQDQSRLSPLFWVSFSTTMVCAALTGIIWGATAKKYKEFDEENGDLELLLTQDPIDWEEVELQHSDVLELKDTVERRSNITIGFGIATGALALATGIILAVDLSRDDEDDSPDVSAAPGGLAVSF
jgi:hypothetical protein